MLLSLADIYYHKALADEERKRIQKLLAFILPHKTSSPLRLRRNLLQAFRRLGCPTLYLRKNNLMPSMQKLLCASNILKASTLSPQEKQALERNPFVIWPDQKHCVCNADALELLAQDRFWEARRSLALFLCRLSNAEKQAWGRYVGLHETYASQRIQTLILYQHLLSLRYDFIINMQTTKFAISQQKYPEYLDEIFPDDPYISPMAWFYRSVLPFYKALAESQKESNKLPSHHAQLIALFQRGFLMAQAVSRQGAAVPRWRVVASQEGEASLETMRQSASASKTLFARFPIYDTSNMAKPYASQRMLFS